MFQTVGLMHSSIQVTHALRSSQTAAFEWQDATFLQKNPSVCQAWPGRGLKKQSQLLCCAAERLHHRLCYTSTTSDNNVITSLWTDGFSQRYKVWKCQRMTAKRKSFRAFVSNTNYLFWHSQGPLIALLIPRCFYIGPISTFWLFLSTKETMKCEI